MSKPGGLWGLVLVAVLGSMPLAAPAAEPGVVLHYDLGRAQGDQAPDLSAGGRTGKVAGQPRRATVHGRACLEFNANSTYVQAQGIGALAWPRGITVEARLRIDGWAGHYSRVITQKAPKAAEAPWELVLGERGRDGTLGFVVRDGRHKPHSSGYTEDLRPHTWYHVIATYGRGGAELHVNGVLKRRGRGGHSIASSAGPLVIAGGSFRGAIAEVIVLDRALTHEEIRARCKSDPVDGVFAPIPQTFSGAVNLVPNPGFEYAGTDQRPLWWQPVFKSHPRFGEHLARSLTATVDTATSFSGKSSLRLSGSKHSLAGLESMAYSVIDYTKSFTLEGRVKCQGATGANLLEIVWYRFWMPMGYGWVTEARNYGSHWDLCEQVGIERTRIASGTHDWQRLAVTARPPRGANFVRFRIWSMNNAGQVWVDDLKFDGLGDAPVEIMLSQSGFSTASSKRAVVRTLAQPKGGRFRLSDAQTGKPRHEGDLRYWGRSKWERHCWIADFSSFTQGGRFRLSAHFDDGTTQRTPAFGVSAGYYDALADALRGYFFMSRCGCDVPGFHKACHLDDGQLRDGLDLTKGGKVVGHVDLSGGWHDAGDYDKFPGAEVWPVYALCRYSELARRAGAQALAKGLFDEAQWGAEHLMKCMADDGRIYYKILRVNRQGQIKMYHLAPEHETDNVVGTEDDRIGIGPGEDPRTCLAVAKFAQTAREIAPELSRRAVEHACKMRQAFLGSERKMAHAAAPLCWFPNILVTDLILHQVTGDAAYRDHAREMAGRIVAAVAGKRYRQPPRSLHTSLPFSAVRSLETYVLNDPRGPHAEAARSAVQQFLRDEIMAHRAGPYGHYDYRLMQDSPWSAHASTKALALSSISALAAILFDDRAYLTFAENQLQYITGLNPLGLCQIGGLGWKQAAVFAWSSSIAGHQDGTVIRGAISKGIPLASGATRLRGIDVYASPHRNIAHPKDYPYLTVAGDYPVMGGAGKQEFYEVPVGVCLLALHDIQRARQHLDRPRH